MALIDRARKVASDALTPMREVAAAFFDLRVHDGGGEKTRKVAETAARRLIYVVADYWLMALSAVLVIGMKAASYEFPAIFIALWVFDLLVAGAFVWFWKVTGKDLSLGEDFRRAVDVISGKSRKAGFVAVTAVLAQSTFWSGPEQVVIFFRRELGGIVHMVLALLVLTAIQALIWALIYSFGYDSVAELINYIKGNPE